MAGEVYIPYLRQHQRIFNAYSSHVRDMDAGLAGDDRSLRKRRIEPRCRYRKLMYLHADTVADSVRKILSKTLFGQIVAARCIKLLSGDSGLCLLTPEFLRPSYRFIYSFEPRRYLPQSYGPSRI